jgi:hypothetical protein
MLLVVYVREKPIGVFNYEHPACSSGDKQTNTDCDDNGAGQQHPEVEVEERQDVSFSYVTNDGFLCVHSVDKNKVGRSRTGWNKCAMLTGLGIVSPRQH